MTLHPQARAHLAATAGIPPVHTLTVREARLAGRGYLALQKEPITGIRVEHSYLVGPTASLPVRIYRPVSSSGAVILMLHGSGFVIADLEISDEPARLLARDTGAVVVTVDYQKAPEHPSPVPADDCWAALQWIFDEAETLGVDPRRVALIGDSAGGTLAATLTLRALTERLPFPLRGQALLYPPLARTPLEPSAGLPADQVSLTAAEMDWMWRHYLQDEDPAAPAVPAAADVLGGLPATFIATAEYDVLRDEAAEFARRLAASGVPVTVSDYAGTIHGFYWMDGVLDAAGDLQRDVAAWLREALE